MKKPILVIMAAGMGSRYGGLKQIDPVDEQGHIIMDFSIYDAKRAGFEKVIFIIKRENEADFKNAIGNRISSVMDVEYAFQELSDLPEGYEVPEGRIKPWGTAHAILSCRRLIDAPFAVINADDYYGRDAFKKIYDYLYDRSGQDVMRITMAGYRLVNTLTENGHVARGICSVGDGGELLGITERTRIERKDGKPAYTEDDGETWNELGEDTIVSMNLWGFPQEFMTEVEKGFPAFLDEGLQSNPLKCEYFLPSVVNRLLAEDKATVAVLPSEDKWYGVTYKEDKPVVVNAIKHMKETGLYPQNLW
jgi:NDP-sugar pyrophosphorylase family protein